MAGIVATAETDIIASPARVWSALTDPAQIKRYMFGSEVETDWKPGGRTAVLSAAIAAMAAPMVFELPFDLIVMARTYPPIPRIRRRRVTVPVTLGRCLGCR